MDGERWDKNSSTRRRAAYAGTSSGRANRFWSRNSAKYDSLLFQGSPSGLYRRSCRRCNHCDASASPHNAHRSSLIMVCPHMCTEPSQKENAVDRTSLRAQCVKFANASYSDGFTGCSRDSTDGRNGQGASWPFAENRVRMRNRDQDCRKHLSSTAPRTAFDDVRMCQESNH